MLQVVLQKVGVVVLADDLAEVLALRVHLELSVFQLAFIVNSPLLKGSWTFKVLVLEVGKLLCQLLDVATIWKLFQQGLEDIFGEDGNASCKGFWLRAFYFFFSFLIVVDGGRFERHS